MPDIAEKPTLLEDLRDRRHSLGSEWDKLIDENEQRIAAYEEAEEKDSEAHQAAEDDFRSSSEQFAADMKQLDARIEQQEEKEQRMKAAAENSVEVSSRARIDEPLVYREDNAHEHPYLFDLMLRDQKVRELTTMDARAGLERLEKHGRQMEELLPKRENERKRAAEADIEKSELRARASLGRAGVRQQELVSPFERRVSPNRLPGQGGEMIPPLWEIDQYSPFLRAGRVIAPLTRNIPLPPGTDVVKVPRIKLGTEVGPQVADNAGVVSKDLETESIEAPIKTIAGMQDVALQAIEMSPNQIFARMVQEDLLAAWNREVDREVSFGAGTSYSTLNAGTIKGLWPASNWGGEAHESGEGISGQVILAGLGCNRAFIATKRFNTDGIVHILHPKRAEFLMNYYETGTEKAPTGRRLFEPMRFPQYNVSGQMDPVTPAEGHVLSLPSGGEIYQSTNITSVNKAATAKEATAYDYGLTFKGDDVWFFESDARMGVFSEVLSGTLSVRFRVYSYVGMLVRFEPSVQVCGGKPFEKEPTLGGYKYGA